MQVSDKTYNYTNIFRRPIEVNEEEKEEAILYFETDKERIVKEIINSKEGMSKNIQKRQEFRIEPSKSDQPERRGRPR